MKYYLTVNENGKEHAWCDCPTRISEEGIWIKNENCPHDVQVGYQLQKGKIEEITGKKITWEDEPYIYEIENEDVFIWDWNGDNGMGIKKFKIALR